MPEQLSNALTFYAYFYSAGAAYQPSPAPTVSVYSPADTALVTGQVSTLLSGLEGYSYTLPSSNVTTEGIYTAVFTTSDTNAAEMVLRAFWEVGTGGVENLDAAISSAGAGATPTQVADAVWASSVRTLSAFGFGVTVTSNSDKAGYSLTATLPTAAQVRQEVDAALVAYDATIPSDLPAAPDNAGIATLLTRLTSARADYLDTLSGLIPNVRDAVWNGLTSAYQITGTLGYLVQQIWGRVNSMPVGLVTVQIPMLDGKDLILYQNADYYSADGSGLVFTNPQYPDLTGATIELLIRNPTNTDINTLSGFVVNANTITVDIPRAITAQLEHGNSSHRYTLWATLANGHRRPLTEGRVSVKQTA